MRVSNARKLLNPHMKNARNEGKMLKMVHVDGRTIFSENNGSLIEIRGSAACFTIPPLNKLVCF